MSAYTEMHRESFEAQVRIVTLVHLATMIEGHDSRVPDALEDLFSEADDSGAWKQIFEVQPKFQNLLRQIDSDGRWAGEDLSTFCYTNCILGFIAEVSTPVRQYHPDDFTSCSLSWGYAHLGWLYAETIEELWQAVKTWADARRAADLEASKKKAKAVQS